MQNVAACGNKNFERRTALPKGGLMLSSIRRLVHTVGLVLIAIAQIIVVWA